MAKWKSTDYIAFPWRLFWYLVANVFRIGFVVCVFMMRVDQDRARRAWEDTE